MGFFNKRDYKHDLIFLYVNITRIIKLNVETIKSFINSPTQLSLLSISVSLLSFIKNKLSIF